MFTALRNTNVWLQIRNQASSKHLGSLLPNEVSNLQTAFSVASFFKNLLQQVINILLFYSFPNCFTLM